MLYHMYRTAVRTAKRNHPILYFCTGYYIGSMCRGYLHVGVIADSSSHVTATDGPLTVRHRDQK